MKNKWLGFSNSNRMLWISLLIFKTLSLTILITIINNDNKQIIKLFNKNYKKIEGKIIKNEL